MIDPGALVELLHGCPKQAVAGLIDRAVLAHCGRPHVGVGQQAHPIQALTLATARCFHAQGWNVVATMRAPREDVLPQSGRLRVIALDVTKPESVAAAVEASGPIDVLVNNAGIGLLGAFEVTPMSTVREVFETNTFGVMAMTQAVLPQFRARRSGVIVNVTSSATLAPMPLVAVSCVVKPLAKPASASRRLASGGLY